MLADRQTDPQNHTSQYLASATEAGWWRRTVVERRSLTGELPLSCARPAADG